VRLVTAFLALLASIAVAFTATPSCCPARHRNAK